MRCPKCRARRWDRSSFPDSDCDRCLVCGTEVSGTEKFLARNWNPKRRPKYRWRDRRYLESRYRDERRNARVPYNSLANFLRFMPYGEMFAPHLGRARLANPRMRDPFRMPFDGGKWYVIKYPSGRPVEVENPFDLSTADPGGEDG